MNNTMIRYSYDAERINLMDSCFENSLIHSCIPYIEKTYRVKADHWNRAIAGLSLSSMQTNDIGFRHPEIFGNMGSFTSTMYHEEYDSLDYERPWPKVMADPASFMKNYKVFFCSATPQEDHIPFFNKDAEIMRDAGIERRDARIPARIARRAVYPLVQLALGDAGICHDAVSGLTKG